MFQFFAKKKPQFRGLLLFSSVAPPCRSLTAQQLHTNNILKTAKVNRRRPIKSLFRLLLRMSAAPLDHQLDCALDMMRRLPPHQVERHLSNLIDVVPDLCEDLLSAVDQPLKVAKDNKVSRYTRCHITTPSFRRKKTICCATITGMGIRTARPGQMNTIHLLKTGECHISMRQCKMTPLLQSGPV